MVANRASIIKVGLQLAELIIENGGTTGRAKALAHQLRVQCSIGGTYQKRYDTHEERVMYRHLNLYKNKLAAAVTAQEKARWKAKLAGQEALIKAHEANKSETLDLDGL